MPRIHRPASPPQLPSTTVKPPTAPSSPPPGASSASSFTSLPPATLPGLGQLALVPRPAPDVEVPGIGKLSAVQAQAVLDGAQAATRQLQQYAQFHGASVTAATLGQMSDAGALKALKELGYAPPADPVQLRAEVGALLDWARAPFELARPAAATGGA